MAMCMCISCNIYVALGARGLKLIFNKDDSLFFEKKFASSWGAPQDNDAKFKFAIHPQGIMQFYCISLTFDSLTGSWSVWHCLATCSDTTMVDKKLFSSH